MSKREIIIKKIQNLIDDLNEVQLEVVDNAIKEVMPKIDKLYLQQEQKKASNSVDYRRNISNYQETNQWDDFY